MGVVRASRLDPIAIGAAGATLVMLTIYLGLMRQEEDAPVAWFVGILLLSTAAALYGAVRDAPHRRAALLVAGLALLSAGTLAILSIGLPIIGAGVLCLAAAGRSGGSAATRPDAP